MLEVQALLAHFQKHSAEDLATCHCDLLRVPRTSRHRDFHRAQIALSGDGRAVVVANHHMRGGIAGRPDTRDAVLEIASIATLIDVAVG